MEIALYIVGMTIILILILTAWLNEEVKHLPVALVILAIVQILLIFALRGMLKQEFANEFCKSTDYEVCLVELKLKSIEDFSNAR